MASGMVPETFPEPLPAYHAELDDEQRIEDQARARGGARFVARNRPEPHRAGDFHHRDAGFDHLEHASESCLDDLESRVLRRSEGRVGPALHGAATLCSAEHATEGGRLGPTLECDHEQRQRARPHAGGVGREPGLWGAIRAGANESGVRDHPHRDLRCGERDRRRLPELHGPSPCTPRHLQGRRDRPGGARCAGRALPFADGKLRLGARRRPQPDPEWSRKDPGNRSRAQGRRRDPRPQGQRWLAACRASRRRRFHHE